MKYIIFVISFFVLVFFGSQRALAGPVEDLYASTTTPVATSTLLLGWTPPTLRENGNILGSDEIAGYEIYFSSPDNVIGVVIAVAGGASNAFPIDVNVPGTYNFAMATIDSGGLKSAMTAIVTVMLVADSAPGIPLSLNASMVICQTGSQCLIHMGN